MGQTLSEPIKEKATTNGEDDRLCYGASCMQGWRISMEDAHTTLLDLLSDIQNAQNGSVDANALIAASKKRISFFAVYDGHGGAMVAEYSGKHLHRYIAMDKEFGLENYREAIKNGFLKTDEELKRDPVYNNSPAGCTAVTALITEDWRLFCGNAGDSRAVLSRNGRAVALSSDHKPQNTDEIRRIKEAGGFVEFGRVNGNLALSRAIGDFEYKQRHDFPPERQIVTADPDIVEEKIQPENDEFVVIACDGIWDCMSNQEVVDFIRLKVAAGLTLGEVAEELMESCVADDLDHQTVGADNMTVLIVAILDGVTTTEWTEKIRQRVKDQPPALNGGQELILAGQIDELPGEASVPGIGFSLKSTTETRIGKETLRH
ncbi:Protein phosphatase 2C 2 [Phlyctochytrium bullatum]|nr:Protein phosphatase 2C 2 [Phlyctochytrium bullatum]